MDINSIASLLNKQSALSTGSTSSVKSSAPDYSSGLFEKVKIRNKDGKKVKIYLDNGEKPPATLDPAMTNGFKTKKRKVDGQKMEIKIAPDGNAYALNEKTNKYELLAKTRSGNIFRKARYTRATELGKQDTKEDSSQNGPQANDNEKPKAQTININNSVNINGNNNTVNSNGNPVPNVQTAKAGSPDKTPEPTINPKTDEVPGWETVVMGVDPNIKAQNLESNEYEVFNPVNQKAVDEALASQGLTHADIAEAQDNADAEIERKYIEAMGPIEEGEIDYDAE